MASSSLPASVFPERAAIVEESGGSVRTLRFGELAASSDALAARLAAAGVERGQAVGVLAPAGARAAVAHIAVLKAGAVTVPLVPLLGEPAIVHRLADAGARVLLVAEELSAQAEALAGRLPQPLRTVALRDPATPDEGAPAHAPCPTGPEDPAIILHTSGTTGKPKGAVLPHRVVLARQVPLALVHGPLLPDDVFWTPADWMWVGSLVDSVLAPLSHGCTVMTYDRRRFDPSAAIARIRDLGVTRAFLPPTALRLLMTAPESDWDGHRLRTVHSGGEQLSADAATWAREALGVVVDEIYGMTEASFLIGNSHRIEEPRTGSIGRPFPGQVVRIAGADRRPVPPGEVGELLVARGSPSLFLGYHGRPDATAARFDGDWFTTGDLMRCDEDGRLHYVGRNDDLIMSAGHRIGPGEIEEALRSHRDVHDAVVVGERDAERGQRIKAVIRLQDGADSSPELDPELQDLVRAKVGRHAYPRAFEYVAEFPLTATGKVRRDLLRLPASERAGSPEPGSAAR